MPTTLRSVAAFLQAPRCAVLSTVGADGAPRQVVVHYIPTDDHVRVNGHRDRRWVANVRRDPRVSIVVHDAGESLHYVSIRGEATIEDEGEAAVSEAMTQAVRYGEDPSEYAEQPRVSVRIDPARVVEYRA